ncbi:MAG: hypothetical protein AB7K09_06740 [Planctomycetota bacterium]
MARDDVDLGFVQRHRREIVNELLPVARNVPQLIAGLVMVGIGVALLVATAVSADGNPDVRRGLVFLAAGAFVSFRQLKELPRGIFRARRRSFIGIARIINGSGITVPPTPKIWRDVESGRWAFYGATLMMCHDPAWAPDAGPAGLFADIVDTMQHAYRVGRTPLRPTCTRPATCSRSRSRPTSSRRRVHCRQGWSVATTCTSPAARCCACTCRRGTWLRTRRSRC